MRVPVPSSIRARIYLFITLVFLIAGVSLTQVLSRLGAYRSMEAAASMVPVLAKDMLQANLLVRRGIAGDSIEEAFEAVVEEGQELSHEISTSEVFEHLVSSKFGPPLTEQSQRADQFFASCREALALDASRDLALERLEEAVQSEVTDLVFLERGFRDLGDDYEYHLEELEPARAQLGTLWQDAVRIQVMPAGEERDQVGFNLALTDERLQGLFLALRNGSDELELDETEEGPVRTALDALIERHAIASASLQEILEGGAHLATTLAGIDDQLDPLLAAQVELEERCSDVITGQLELLRTVTLASFAAVLIIVTLLARFLQRGVLARISDLKDIVHGIAEGDGDLTQRIPLRKGGELDELAHWFNAFLADMESIVAQIRGVGQDLLAANSRLEGEGRSVAEASKGQAQDVDQASQRVEDMRTSTSGTSTLAHSVRDAATNAETHVTEGLNSAQKMKTSIVGLNETSDKVRKAMQAVEEVAFQTRLLALNATVEAARAGDAGRGFGVVAEEVRNLAVRSAETATSIVRAIELSQSQSEAGLQEVEALVKTLGSIHEAAGETASFAREISEACNGQVTIASTASQSIQGIGVVSQANAERAHRLEGVCHETNDLSINLAELVGRFRVSERGLPHVPVAVSSSSLSDTGVA